MIKIENIDVYGWEAAIRGMRNPMNSWDKSDTIFDGDKWCMGENDLRLMKSLSKAGNDHAKFLRMINVTMDITAPLYWWKEHDQYKVGTTTNSCSTMHKIQDREFTLDDFSIENLYEDVIQNPFNKIIDCLNFFREIYLLNKDKDDWWQMIQLLPSSYNQKRTVQLNYAVLKNMYFARRNHKLDEWRTFCNTVLSLPYFEAICVDTEEAKV